MVVLQSSEIFKEIKIDAPLKRKYAISNYGRLISFDKEIKDGTVLKGGTSEGYRTLRYKIKRNGKTYNVTIFLYRLMAEFFIPKTSEDQTNILHLDHSRDNDKLSNLKWATRDEMLEHRRKSPAVIAATLERNSKPGGCYSKLTSTQVIRLKKRLLDPNRKTRVRILAKEFGVSEMTLHRIRTGENWGHIKV